LNKIIISKDGKLIGLSSAYEQARHIIGDLKSLGFIWSKKRKLWIGSILNYHELASLLKEEEINFVTDVNISQFYAKYENEYMDIQEQIKSNTQGMYKHQIEDAAKLVLHREWGLFNDMGTGKTRTTIEAMKIINPSGKILIICPLPVKKVWLNELQKWGNGLNKNIVVFTKDGIVGDITIVNYEMFVRHADRIVSDDIEYLVLDEAHRAKNRKTKTFQIIASLSNVAEYKALLTGTPIGNNAEEIFNVLSVMRISPFGYYSAFINKFCTVDWFGKIRGSRNTEELNRRVAKCSSRRTKKDCLDLPDKVYSNVNITLSTKEEELYNSIMYEARQLLGIVDDDKIRHASLLTQIIRLSQAINCPWDITSGKINNCTKLTYTIDFVQDFIDNRNKLIVWSTFVSPLKRLHKMFASNSVLFIGETSKKIDVESEMKKDENIILFANPQCAGFGLNLQFISNMVYYCNDYSFIRRKQSEDRCHRIGTKGLTITDLIGVLPSGEESIDERIVDVLNSKEKLSTEVLERMIS
jgi:SNF2 family DNA or RNA helicase